MQCGTNVIEAGDLKKLLDCSILNESCELSFLFLVLSTQCSKDCGPYKRACEYGRMRGAQSLSMRMCTGMLFFTVCSLIFLKFPQLKIRVNQLNMLKNYCINFLTMKDTIFDTHGTIPIFSILYII